MDVFEPSAQPLGTLVVTLLPNGQVQLSIQNVPNGWGTVFAMLGQAVAIAGTQREASLAQDAPRVEIAGMEALRRIY